MAFTDNCDLFVSIHEDGVNRIGWHIMRQRPSLFNYATADVAANRELWCEMVDFTSDVTKFGNPIFTIQDPLPVIGADNPPVGLDFIAQVTAAQVDFHPSNVIGLPPELGPELSKQQLAIELKVCGGIGCPDPHALDRIRVPRSDVAGKDDHDRKDPPQVHVPGKMLCFCLDVFVTAHAAVEYINGVERLVGKVDGVEIVDVEPNGLEANMECYIRTAVTLFLRQKLAVPLQTLFVDFPLFGSTVLLSPTPNPPVPNNPAIEEDQLKAFMTMTVTGP